MITIFTPIYNRAYVVHNLYQSLLRQTNYDFEWLIVDDGSTDNISELVCQWKKSTCKFKIRFYRQENSGKHCAINRGLKLANGKAFFIVDSDDYLEDNAVETILKNWRLIESDSMLAGIAGLRRRENGEIIGGLPQFTDFIDATNLERERFGLEGDKAEVYKTELLRKFPFPVYENENFLTEGVIWDKIAYEGYKLRWINKSFTICEYLQDGLTAKGEQLFLNNPKGWANHLRGEKEYRKIIKDEYLKWCYYYYENEHGVFNQHEIKELLDLEDTEINMIVTQYTEFIQKLLNICANQRICMYAYGKWGKRLKRYLDHLEIDVSYVVDRQFDKICDIKSYSIEMDLPQVDVVLIALNEGAENINEIMKNKMPKSKIFLLKDLKPEFW